MLDRHINPSDEKIRIGINIKTEAQRETLKKYFPDMPEIERAKYIEVSTRWKEFFLFQREGLEPELILEINKQEWIDDRFHTLQQINSILKSLENQYNSICKLEKIGESAFYNLPITGVKISDFPYQNEDEPSVLFTAAHHANEPLGVEICLNLINYLCNNYVVDNKVKQWVDNLEIWFVPVVNPDGYQLVMNNESKIIWRKNLRDNNKDGKFSSEIDGVDLNRNYDFNWAVEGDRFSNSHYYPGAFSFSEPETQAIRDLAKRERFVFHLDFHSAGEMILYPINNLSSPQDEKTIEMAKEIARNIKKNEIFSHYSIAPMNDKVGQCALWMYNELGVLSFIVEAGDSYFPSGDAIQQIVEQNSKAAFWILDKGVRLNNFPICILSTLEK